MKKKIIVVLVVLLAFLGGVFVGINKQSQEAEKPVKIENREAESVDIKESEPENITEIKCKEIEKEIAEKYGDFDIYKTSDLDFDMLSSRTKWSEKVIVERTTGTVLNDDLDGQAEEWYISYKSVEGAQTGDQIISYFVYNPETDYEDDIIERYDVIVEK